MRVQRFDIPDQVDGSQREEVPEVHVDADAARRQSVQNTENAWRRPSVGLTSSETIRDVSASSPVEQAWKPPVGLSRDDSVRAAGDAWKTPVGMSRE